MQHIKQPTNVVFNMCARPLPLWHAMAKEKYKAHLLESKVTMFYHATV